MGQRFQAGLPPEGRCGVFQQFFRPDGKFFVLGSKAGDLIAASVLWLVTSLPLITVGPATTALYYVVLHSVREDREGVWRAYFRMFRREFRQSMALMLLYTAWAAACFLAGHLYQSAGGDPDSLAAWLLRALLLPALLSMPYGFAMIARFENSLGRCVLLSLYLAFRHPAASLALAALLAAGAFLVYLQLTLAVFLPGAVCLAMSFLLERVFRQHMPDPPAPGETPESSMENGGLR